MGNYLSTCNNIKSVSIIKSTKNDLPLASKITIRLLLIGLDNSGKTSTALHLLKKPLDDIVPTLGFDSYLLDSPALTKNKDTKVELIDLGGSIKIRKLWDEYFPTAHGLICLLDSADSGRFKELKTELERILSNENVKEKPILVLLNKMDLDDAMDEVEILNEINIEQLVNDNKCPTKIEQCAIMNKDQASNEKKKKPNLDSGIEQGFNWIVNYILNNWEKLDTRVRTEMQKEEKQNKEKMDALREKYKNNKNEDESNQTDQDKKENPFKPIDEVVKDLEKKEESTKNGLRDVKEDLKKVKKDETKKSKPRSIEKLTEKINEVKKKAMVVRQNKVQEKDKTQIMNEKNASIEKQDSKDSKDKNLKDIKEENEKIDTIDKNANEVSQNSTATNSMDTISQETVIEVKK